MLEYIKQRHDWDCGVAALAMATDRSYEDAERALGFPLSGINELHINNWLGDNGYAWALKYRAMQLPPGYGTHGRDNYVNRKIWPPLPFAPTHILLVEATAGAHFIVMDGTGTVYDPWKEERKTLQHPDYKRVNWVQGIFYVRTMQHMSGSDYDYDKKTIDLST